MALLIVFFSPSTTEFPPLHLIRGYWRHVGLMRHICFIISRRGMIMVIDGVTSSLSSSVIGAYCSEIQWGAIRVRAEGPCCERYHGHLMGGKRNGLGVCVRVCLCVIPLRVRPMMTGLTVGALTECQSHFEQTTILAVQSLAAALCNTSIMCSVRRAVTVATETNMDAVEVTYLKYPGQNSLLSKHGS